MYNSVEFKDGSRRPMSKEEKENPELLPTGSKVYRLTDLVSSGRTETCVFDYNFNEKTYSPGREKSWRTTPEGMKVLDSKKRLSAPGKTLQFVTYYDDFPAIELTNFWDNVGGEPDKSYVVQTSTEIVQRCI
jgi:adenine-specific DNA-methyltransferase